MVYDRSCFRLDELFPVVSRWPHLGIGKRKICQYGGVGFELLCTPFDHVIAGSYKKGSAHHCKSEMYVWSLCSQSFSTQGSLKRLRIRSSSIGRFFLSSMQQTLYRKDHLGRHLKTHQPVELCGDSVACATNATVDSPPPPPSPPPKKHGERPVCDVCAKSFASQKTLKRHRETVHRQSGGFSCRVCDRRFYRREQLKRHHISNHADEEYETPASHTCLICQKSFHYRDYLREHLNTHPAATSSPPTSPASPLAPPASGLRTDARTWPFELTVSVPKDCRQGYRDNWWKVRPSAHSATGDG